MKSLVEKNVVLGTQSVNPIVWLLKMFFEIFLDSAPQWYKFTILGFLVVNPLLLFLTGPFITGWIIIAQFIFTLAMALKCYPLPAGGLIAIEAVAIGMTTTEAVYQEVVANFAILLLLMFMVAGIYFMKDMLRFVFSDVLVRIKSKIALSLLFCVLGIVLSAFLDALTVVAIVMAVCLSFYEVYHKFASRRGEHEDHDLKNDEHVQEERKAELVQFQSFLRSLLMHAAVGTALGGVCTLVGEPQNLIIGNIMEWHFVEFAIKVSPVTFPVLVVGLATCYIVEKKQIFGYGQQIPHQAREVISDYVQKQHEDRDTKATIRLLIQGAVAILLVIGLATHLAEVGIIGLAVIILLTSLTGVTEEHHIGEAFKESLPFAGLLVVFFAIVAVIHENHLFSPIIHWVLEFEGKAQLLAFFGASGLLSAISDNVFVATIYITEAKNAFEQGMISREQFDLIAVAINTGTNIPSVATPNGQAAFLFLLTSSIAGLIRLSYGKMLKMAVPYTLTMTTTAVLAVWFLL